MTGAGFVYKRMKREFCCTAPSLPDHCFAHELSESGGGWLDAPQFFPAGSMARFPPSYEGGPEEIGRTSAWRE